ncbi:MAG: hypothetical protein V2I33_21630, partial [Kangiellaceae bacterium]|nr:hypothetical protein [Kangiellaceae bacterium]
MNLRLLIFHCCLCICSQITSAQKTSITYELNGRQSNKNIKDSIGISKNPFSQFIGEWTLKSDTWIQNWGNSTDTLLIPKHHTVSSQINTDNSLLS